MIPRSTTVAIALVGVWAGVGLAQSAIEDAIAEGDRLMRAARTVDAIAAFREGLAADPDSVELLWRTAIALASRAQETPGRDGDEEILEEALRLARRAVELGPRVSRAHTALAIAAGRYGDHVGHVYRMSRAREVIDLGRESKTAADRALALDPSDFAPYVILGVYHRELATLHPVVKGIARVFLGGFPDVSLEESEDYLRQARRLAPDRITTRVQLARTYLRMDRETAGRAELEAALGLEPQNALEREERERARELLDRIG